MNSNVEMVEDVATYVDFNELFFTPRFAADCFGLTTRRLKDIEESNNIEIRRVPRGTVTSRVYTPSDLFDLAALRRELGHLKGCLLYTSPSPRDKRQSRMPSSA